LTPDRVETAATVKADAYGLGIGPVARALAQAGAKTFFVAIAEEGAALRDAVGPDPRIMVYAGHMAGDTDMIGDLDLIPMLNSIEQMTRHFEALPGRAFGIQLDSGMNRLGMEPAEWTAVRGIAERQEPTLLITHLACADEPGHQMNKQQLRTFRSLTKGFPCRRSIAATGGVLLGEPFHFAMTRPGIGLYGGFPFENAQPVVRLSLPVIQTRDLEPGETVGYGNTWEAEEPSRIATVSGGYADGLLRALSNRAMLFAGDVPCPLVGRVSMDLITVDISHLDGTPKSLDILGPHQTVDDLADGADTIGYEILTSLGARYTRRYIGSGA
jgi:alanine racemase